MKGLPDLNDVGRLVARVAHPQAVVGATPAQRAATRTARPR